MTTIRKPILIALFLIAGLACTSCVTRKSMTYFRNLDKATIDSINRLYTPVWEPTVQIGDLLTISVSALDADAAAPYNLPALIYADPSSTSLTTTPSLQGYMVASDGMIDFPILGKLAVNGLTQTQVKALIEERLSSQLVNPEVVVNVLNQTVSILGEIVSPGKYPLQNGRLTVVELLAQAGDLTIYGKRDNVLIVREIDGKMQYGRINLNDAQAFASPWFFLQPHDVVYVAPNSVRAVQSQNVGLWLSMVSTLASAATVIVTVVNAVPKSTSPSQD